MDYLATVRDGSTGALVNGYWLLELYASLSHKNPVPVLLEPFSHEEPYSPGQNPVVLAAVHKIFERTHNRGVRVVDRGFDGGVMFEDWLDNRYRFVARLVGERHLLRCSGGSEPNAVGQWVPIRARQLAEQVPTPYRFDKLIKRRGKPAIRITQIGWMKVRLPGRAEVLTLVISRLAGQDKPMMLLTNVPATRIGGLACRDSPGCQAYRAFLHPKVGMRGSHSLFEKSRPPGADPNVSLVRDSSSGFAGRVGHDVSGLALGGPSPYL